MNISGNQLPSASTVSIEKVERLPVRDMQTAAGARLRGTWMRAISRLGERGSSL